MTRDVFVVDGIREQGAAVVDHLLSGAVGDVAVTASTPHPYNARRSVASLRDRGVDVVRGDLDDPASYRTHLADADAAFLVTATGDGGADTEAVRGRGFVDAAMDAGVDHLVYGSAMGTDRPGADGIQALSGKRRVEAYLREVDLSYTVVRPGLLVQRFERQRDAIADGTVAWPVEPDTRLAVVDADDVGSVVTSAMADPGRFDGVHVDVAGDVLTLAEIADGFAEVRGHHVTAEHVTDRRERERFGDLTAERYAWFDANGGHRLDPAPLADLDLHPRSLYDALQRTGWAPDTDEEEALPN
ncbi:NmrA family NAD(P)-binding protein [Halorubellus sp. JP-L1]|uniref:NmrA family NAD(P)-binding protein n=1 Tax=Halorubellus sp. JP-L1 TaxID=2715753 RepID=UPI001409EF58|nr:NmrA family NAD(P)-binding protein [Halorubellus sp. JP-L1]NHN41016.1 NmrA family NAD(P)-binding protein [Halorubellus sp. JP-L1]